LDRVSLTPVFVTKTVGGLVLKDVLALQGSDGSLSFTRDVAAVLNALSVARPALPPACPTWPDDASGLFVHAPKPEQPQDGPERRVASPSKLQHLRAALARWFG
jgi:hypothetical protein